MGLFLIVGQGSRFCHKTQKEPAKSAYCVPRLRIRIHIIRIHHFRLNTDPDPKRIQGFNDQKLRKKITSEKKFKFFFDQKLQFTCPQASIKNVQVTEEVFSSQKRPFNTSKHDLLKKFLLVGHFCPPGSTDPIESGSNPDPQPCCALFSFLLLKSVPDWPAITASS